MCRPEASSDGSQARLNQRWSNGENVRPVESYLVIGRLFEGSPGWSLDRGIRNGGGVPRWCDLHPGDLYAQTSEVLRIMTEAIEELGGSIEDVIRTRVFVTDITRWEEAGRAHGEVFGDVVPASAFLEVSRLLHRDMLVEIEATAYVE